MVYNSTRYRITKSRRGLLQYWIIRAAFAVALGWFAIDGIMQFRAFFFENHGIEYYQERPHLLWVCAAAAIVIGLLVKLSMTWHTKIKKRKGVGSSPSTIDNQREGKPNPKPE